VGLLRQGGIWLEPVAVVADTVVAEPQSGIAPMSFWIANFCWLSTATAEDACTTPVRDAHKAIAAISERVNPRRIYNFFMVAFLLAVQTLFE
jgi:hypothetical protein